MEHKGGFHFIRSLNILSLSKRPVELHQTIQPERMVSSEPIYTDPILLQNGSTNPVRLAKVSVARFLFGLEIRVRIGGVIVNPLGIILRMFETILLPDAGEGVTSY